jgi:chromosome segregation ATPase
MESRVEDSILNHSVVISRIEDCEDNMQICKGDVDSIKIEQVSMARDIRMLEVSMGSVHEQLEDLGDRVDGCHAANRRMASLHKDHTRFITTEVLKVCQEGRAQHEGCLGKIERIGDLIDKKIVHMDEELDKVVGLIGQRIDSKFGEFSSDFMEAMEIEENRRKDMELRLPSWRRSLWTRFSVCPT